MIAQIKLGLKFLVAVPIVLGIAYLVSLPGMQAWRAKDFDNPMFIFFGLGAIVTVAAFGCAIVGAMQLCAGCISILGGVFTTRHESRHEESEHQPLDSSKAADGVTRTSEE